MAAPQSSFDLSGFRFSSVGPHDVDSDPRVSAYFDSREGEDIAREIVQHEARPRGRLPADRPRDPRASTSR